MPINDASNLSLRLPMVSSRYDTVVVEADDGDADEVDRIGEMLEVIGDGNSLVSCFDTPERLARSLADFFEMAMGADRGDGDDVEDECCCDRRI
jgi:GTP cyclohydrolase I